MSLSGGVPRSKSRVWKQTSGRLDERKDGTDDVSDDDDDTDSHNDNDNDNDDVPPSPLETDGPWATRAVVVRRA